MTLPRVGRLLGVDPGSRRIGLAITDADQRVVSPLATLARTTAGRDAQILAKLAADEAVVGVVVGLPVLLSGEEGTQARRARHFAAWLAEVTGRPVDFADERFTSSHADDLMSAAGLTRKQQVERRDRLAALVILEGYLAHRTQESASDGE